MKAVKIFCLSIIGLLAAYVLHVPALKGLSALTTSSELRAYPELSEGLKSDSYEIVRLIYGWSEVWFDQQASTYLIIADLIEDKDTEYPGRFVVYVEKDGHITNRRRATSADPLPDVEGDPRYIRLNPTPEQMYVPTYSFDALAGRLELVKYQFSQFSEWPYFYYFFPVVPFDWEGVGYYKLTHRGETLLFQQPTNFYGGLLYLTQNVDGQLYLIEREDDASGVAFVKVAESSYSRLLDGGEIHRAAYGLHVIRPRR